MISLSLLRIQAGKALRFARQNGLRSFFRLLKRRLSEGRSLLGKIPVLQEYEFVIRRAIGAPIQSSDVELNTINWFIPAVGKGSGGHLNIFRFIKNLETHGFESRIIIVGSVMPPSADKAKAEIESWFFPLAANVYLGAQSAPAAYFSMATSWQTAYFVRDFQPTLQRCYFVQDFEPWFYSAGSESMLAEATYYFGFHGFTAGSWLAKRLNEDYGMVTCGLGFSFDRELYKPLARDDDGVRRVFFYARPPTARRAFELGLLVLREVCQALPEVEVVIAGWDVSSFNIPFPCRQAGLVELADLPQLYSQCDAALVLSCTNLSLLPLELMACGVPVISNRGAHTEWLLNEQNCVLADATIEDLAQKVVMTLCGEGGGEKLRQSALEFALSTSWTKEVETMANELKLLTA